MTEPEAEILRRKDVLEWLGWEGEPFDKLVQAGAIIGVKPYPKAKAFYLKAYIKSKLIEKTDEIKLNGLLSREPRGRYIRRSDIVEWLRIKDRNFDSLITNGWVTPHSFTGKGRNYYDKNEIKKNFIDPFIGI